MNQTSAALVPRPLRRRLLKSMLVVVALVVVFWWLLPQFIDYDQVWAALTQLDAWEVVVLFGVGLARIPTEALMYRAFLPRLGLLWGSQAYLSSNFAGLLLPPPTASVVQYGYFRAAGYEPNDAGLAALGSFLFPTIGRFLLPCVALVLLLATGEVSGAIWLAGALSLAVSTIAGVAGYVFLRKERSARWLGARTQRPLSWILVKLKRTPIEDGATQAADLRAKALSVLREGWLLGTIGVTANLLLTYLILLAALRFVGVSATELPAAEAFAAFAIAFWAGAVFPITGSGLGVVDAVLFAMLIELGSASDDTLLAAALLWRVFYTALPLPLGAIALSRYRKANPGAPPGGTAETPTT